MQITGKNLELVAQGLEAIIDSIHYHIASCPDVIEYADSIEEYEADKHQFKVLLAKVNKALEKEKP